MVDIYRVELVLLLMYIIQFTIMATLVATDDDDSSSKCMSLYGTASVLWYWGRMQMGPVPYGPIMTSSAISKSPIWFQQASHNDVSKQ